MPNNWGLKTNSKLIPEGHFMQVETRTSQLTIKIRITKWRSTKEGRWKAITVSENTREIIKSFETRRLRTC